MISRQRSLKRLFIDAIGKYRWDDLARVYSLLEWKWVGVGVPTSAELRETAERLAGNVIEHSAESDTSYGASAGGLHVGYESDSDGKFNVYVAFSLEAFAYEDLVDCINRGGYRDPDAPEPKP